MDKKTGLAVGVGIGIAGMAYMAFKRNAPLRDMKDPADYGLEIYPIPDSHSGITFIDKARSAGLF